MTEPRQPDPVAPRRPATRRYRRGPQAAAVKLVLAAAVVLVCGAGTVAGAAAASTASAAAPPPVDHQLCYTAAAEHFRIPPKVTLYDQFSPKGFTPKIGAAVLHCNPVKKILPSGKVFGITHPADHLMCFTITAPQQPTPEVLVTNQFGQAKLTTGQPNLLCLPSWKSLTGPPGKSPNQPPGLNHFTCYPVQLVKGSGYHNVPPFVGLEDEFARKLVHHAVRAQVSAVPQELCLPTKKVVGTKAYPIINPILHLLCFPVSPTPIVPRVWDENQFGTSVVGIRQTQALCLPSTKKIIIP